MRQNSNSEMPGNGRGRPKISDALRKRARNVSVSDSAWENLTPVMEDLNVKTVSELLEQIGKGKIVLRNSDKFSSLNDLPIYRRLKSLISEPVAVFWSVLAFVVRVCQQLGFEPTSERIYDTTMKACSIIFYIGYTHPDVLINNPSALIRWICYQIIKAEALSENIDSDSKSVSFCVDDPHIFKKCYDKIVSTFNRLNAASHSPNYRALQMKTINGLSIKQISRIFNLQKWEVDKAEVSIMIKKGLADLRELFDQFDPHQPFVQLNNSVEKLPIPPSAKGYLELALKENLLNSDAHNTLEELLMKTNHDPYLDFWFNEIDYYLVDRQEQARDRIAKHLGEHLKQKKLDIDPLLASCSNKEQIRDLLSSYAEQEAGVKLAVDVLLGETTQSLTGIGFND
jgi:hypothetical protein